MTIQIINLGVFDLGTVDLGTTVVKERLFVNLANTITCTIGFDINNLNIYNRTILLEDQVKHIIKRDIQPTVKTIIKSILQKEVQGEIRI